MSKKTVVTSFCVFMILIQVCIAQQVKVLTIVADNYSPNCFLNEDQFEEHGWSVTYTGLTREVKPCAFFIDIPNIVVDTLITEIQDVTGYDVLALMPSSSVTGRQLKDIMQSPEAMNLIKTAIDTGLVFWTSCSGARVLAALDVIRGKKILGPKKYQDEYEQAGAIYLGTDHPPVTEGNIITCIRDQYYYIHNVEAIATALEKSTRKRKSLSMSKNLVKKNKTSLDDDDIMWSKTFGGSGADAGRSIYPTNDGGFIIAGYTFSFGAENSDIYLLKTDADGNELWSKTFGGSGWEYAYSVIQTSDSGFLIAGYTTSKGAGCKDVYVIKTDNQGNLLWDKTYGGENKDVGRAVCQAVNGDFIINGYTDSYSQGEEEEAQQHGMRRFHVPAAYRPAAAAPSRRIPEGVVDTTGGIGAVPVAGAAT